jgi:benzylsuccinate CoA-transferase BbsF subunit
LTTRTGYLSDVRVLDFSRNLAGPYSTLLLGFLGAEIIQVENPYLQEVMRRNSPAQCADLRLNKLSLGIDLTKPASIEIVKELAAISDVAVEAFKAGTMTRLGIGYDVLEAVNPRIVMVSLSGMGQTGPEANYRAYAQIFGVLGGLAHYTGYRDGIPTEQRASLDHRAGQMVAFAALAGVAHSRRTGQGQHIDVSARECLTSEIGDLLMDYAMNGRDRGPTGNDDAFMAPHNCYRCEGDDAWVTIAVADDREWESLCGVLGRPDLVADERFRTQLDRWKHREELDDLVGRWTISHTNDEVTDILQRSGVAAFAVVGAPQVFSDPHLRARGSLEELDDPAFGSRTVLAPPWRLWNRPARIVSPSPAFSEHNRHIMTTLLGMSEAEVEELEAQGVLLPGQAVVEASPASP